MEHWRAWKESIAFSRSVWRNLFDENDGLKIRNSDDEAVARGFRRLIKKVGEDIERLGFNTCHRRNDGV